MTGLPRWAATVAASAALVGVLGAALGAFAWTTPTAAAPGAEPVVPQAMTFSYTATVPRSPAYDDTTVTAPQPVFRELADTLEVTYDYVGTPGSVAVVAELSATNGWTSTLPLQAAHPFSGAEYAGTVDLDLDALDQRAQRAASATGLPAGDVTVEVVATVTTADGRFEAGLPLVLSPLRLTLTGGAPALEVSEPGTTPSDVTGPVLSLAGRDLPVATARAASVVMVGCALLAVVLLGLLARWTAPASELAAIRRRHGHLLLDVQPFAPPTGPPVIDVDDFATLARLAERYEALVLHWTRSDVDTFVVQDQAATYRYRYRATAAPAAAPADGAAAPGPEPVTELSSALG